MKSTEALEYFREYAIETKRDINSLPIPDLTKFIIDFYINIRADDCDPYTDQDMLLFQWGAYDWGEGEFFEYDLTRQFMPPNSEEPFQLSTTVKYATTPQLKSIQAGNKWCTNPIEASDFLQFILKSDVTKIVSNLKIETVKLHFEGV